MVLIRDLSVYDPPPVPYGDYDGLVIRCYNGTRPDTQFNTHKAGAIAANVPWWPYAFYNFLYPALPQVEAVLEILHDEPGCLPVYFDVEEWGGHKYPPREQLLEALQTLYANYKAATGNNCGFYMNPATIHYLRPVPNWLLTCPLWIAHWLMFPPDFEPWPRWTFHQYIGEPDLNKYNGTDEEYFAFVGGQPPPPPPPPPPLPDIVRITADALNIRVSPMGNRIGQLPKGFECHVTGDAWDDQGRRWWQSGTGYFASWFAETVDA